MHNSEARRRKERQKEQIKQRYNVVIDPETTNTSLRKNRLITTTMT